MDDQLGKLDDRLNGGSVCTHSVGTPWCKVQSSLVPNASSLGCGCLAEATEATFDGVAEFDMRWRRRSFDTQLTGSGDNQRGC